MCWRRVHALHDAGAPRKSTGLSRARPTSQSAQAKFAEPCRRRYMLVRSSELNASVLAQLDPAGAGAAVGADVGAAWQ